mgnify:CR=1 FL=1
MALTATASQGFEKVRTTGCSEIMWLPGDPGVTFTKGDEVALGTTTGNAGLLILATDSLVDCVGRVAKTTICPAATQAFPKPGGSDKLPKRPVAETRDLLPSVPRGTNETRSGLSADRLSLAFAQLVGAAVAGASGMRASGARRRLDGDVYTRHLISVRKGFGAPSASPAGGVPVPRMPVG